MSNRDFFELGDGYRASELFPIDSLWYVNAKLPGVLEGEIVRVHNVDDGTDGRYDDSRVETSNGFYTGTEAMEFFESAAHFEMGWNKFSVMALPPPSTVMVYVEFDGPTNPGAQPRILLAWYSADDGRWRTQYGRLKGRITHWMLLPAPPTNI